MIVLKIHQCLEFKIPNRLCRWLALIASLLLLGLVAFVFLPWLSEALGFKEAHALIIEEKIDAGAWFYIFVEKIWSIEPAVSDGMQYAPKGF